MNKPNEQFHLDETREAKALEDALMLALPDWLAMRILGGIVGLIEANEKEHRTSTD